MNIYSTAEKNTGNLTVDEAICRMAEFDLLHNLDEGAEYTGFKGLYCEGMMERDHVFKHGFVYDVKKPEKLHHLLLFLKRVLDEETEPEMIMTSGTFLSMNKPLQRAMVEYLKLIASKGSVSLYSGNKKVIKLFDGSNVKVTIYDRENHSIIHFIKTKKTFIFVMPHNEEKVVRVDISSDTFEPQVTDRILTYFDKLVMEFDESIKKNSRTGNNVNATKHT